MNYRIIFILSLILANQSFGQFGFERTDAIQVKSGLTDYYENAWAGGIDYAQFSNIDLNFDGENDLFVFDRTCNKVLTFIHTGGSGSDDFEYAPEYEEIFPEMQSWALLVDYNCDGMPDIFTYTLGTAKVYMNTGNSTDGHAFEEEAPYLRTTTWSSEVFMYFASNDIPAIVDVDGDNDIDVLTFGVGGLTIEYHKNMSMETYGVCDSLLFITENLCWGRFRESGATNEVTLWDTLVYPCDGSYPTPESWHPGGLVEHTDRHAGSTVLALDLDDDGVMDLILGDVSYNNLVMLMNSGSAPNMNSGMDFQETNYPSTSIPVDLEIMPAAFHVDVDADGNRDLLVGTNTSVGAMNHNSVWYYNNSGADLTPDFEYQQNDFLQSEMVETGSGSLPVLFDHNGDGLKDLIVSQHQRYNDVTGLYECRMYYFENTGTAAIPEFTFVDEDYQNFSLLGVGSGLSYYPAFGDLDNDGDEDMIVGDYHGYCYYFENTGGFGSPAFFSTFDTLRNSAGEPIFHSTYAYPAIVDLDRDGDNDVVIGRRTGAIQYYENTGSASSMQLEFQTGTLGGVDVSEYWSIEGQAVPVFLDIDDEYHLVLGSKSGYLHYYTDIDDNLTGDFTLVDSTLDNLWIGTWSAPTIFDLNGDDKFDMILGNQRGGISLYSSGHISQIGIPEQEFEVSLFPNPANTEVVINSTQYGESLTIKFYSLEGKEIKSVEEYYSGDKLDVSDLSDGVYTLMIESSTGIASEKLTIVR